MIQEPLQPCRQRRIAGLRIAALPATRSFRAEHGLYVFAQCRCQRTLIARSSLQFGKRRTAAMIERTGQRVAFGSGCTQCRPSRGEAAFRLVSFRRSFGAPSLGLRQCCFRFRQLPLRLFG